ncbi:DUF397 domain-containing protein [Streptomyces sp. NPDC020800]|uniref:DUF397 domain-containing protein n=1 Tax=Streptomyces sp. NPDC020800 TaxID=3365092 RepID=UPI0037BE11DC
MPELTWQKSTYSGDASNCVEIATTPSAIHIRDSKTGTGPQVTVTPSTWGDFLQHAADAGGSVALY